jgi:hypothetical protein
MLIRLTLRKAPEPNQAHIVNSEQVPLLRPELAIRAATINPKGKRLGAGQSIRFENGTAAASSF